MWNPINSKFYSMCSKAFFDLASILATKGNMIECRGDSSLSDLVRASLREVENRPIFRVKPVAKTPEIRPRSFPESDDGAIEVSKSIQQLAAGPKIVVIDTEDTHWMSNATRRPARFTTI